MDGSISACRWNALLYLRVEQNIPATRARYTTVRNKNASNAFCQRHQTHADEKMFKQI